MEGIQDITEVDFSPRIDRILVETNRREEQIFWDMLTTRFPSLRLYQNLIVNSAPDSTNFRRFIDPDELGPTGMILHFIVAPGTRYSGLSFEELLSQRRKSIQTNFLDPRFVGVTFVDANWSLTIREGQLYQTHRTSGPQEAVDISKKYGYLALEGGDHDFRARILQGLWHAKNRQEKIFTRNSFSI